MTTNRSRIRNIAGLTAVGMILSLAAFSPKQTFEFISAPVRWADDATAQSATDDSLAYWADTKTRADLGDPEAMYRLGTKLKAWTNENVTGLQADPVESERLIRAAAGRGHLDARLSVWLLDGMDPAELVNISDQALAEEKNVLHLASLSEWLRWVALQDCNEQVNESVEQVFDVVRHFPHVESLANSTEEHNEFVAQYETECGVAQH